MKPFCTALLFSVFIQIVPGYSQEGIFDKSTVFPCGTPIHFTAWEREFHSNPVQYRNGGDTVLWVPMTIHNVGNDNGAGFLSTSRILDGLCRLNQDYTASKIQFYLSGDIRYIKNTRWNNHDSLLVGAEMMFANNVSKTVNCYLNSVAAGNAGYNLPYAGVSLLKGVVNITDHTWAHEVGHNLTLQHPFLGWEGKQYDNTWYSKPTPDRVTYDYTLFKDSLIIGKTIIDTAWVELTDKSNCAIASDKVCDSKPDYLSYRWNCNAANESLQLQKDPNNVDFRSDGTLFMSYASDACMSRFSDQQIAKMRANLLGPKASYLTNPIPKDAVTASPVLVTPINSQTVQFDNVVLKWDPVQNATHYNVQVSRLSNFDILEADLIVTDTKAMVSNLIVDKTYYWRVRPYNQFSFCAAFSTRQSFKTANVTSINDPAAESAFVLSPSFVYQGQSIFLSARNAADLWKEVQVFDMNGQIVYRTNHTGQPMEIPTAGLPSGMYVVLVKQSGIQQHIRMLVR